MYEYKIEEMITYEDKDILVCTKPAGLPVQTARLGSMDLESLLKNHIAAENPRQMPYLAVIHRLDQPVEGILVFAKNKNAAAKLNRQLQKNQMNKEYLAVVHGKPEQERGQFVDFLKKDGRTNTSRATKEQEEGSKKAVLNYQLMETVEEYSLIKIQLMTGRHHQIRVQMAHHRLPLAGDHKYGIEDPVKNVVLCAFCLELMHPSTGKKMQFKVKPKGEPFQEFRLFQS